MLLYKGLEYYRRVPAEKHWKMEDQNSTITTESIAADPVTSLLEYVSKYWFYHVKTIQFDIERFPEISQLPQRFMVHGEKQYKHWATYYPFMISNFWKRTSIMRDLQPTSMAVLGLVVLGIYPAAMQWGQERLESNPECVNVWGNSILFLAAKHGHDTLSGQLIDLGRDINRTMSDDYSALRVALWRGNKTCAITLLEHGSYPNLGGKQHSLFYVIADCYDKALLELLISKGAHPEALRPDYEWGCTPLMTAAYFDNTEAAVALIEAGARVNFPGGELGTPLIKAAEGGSLQVAKLLVSHGADVDCQNQKKYGSALVAAFCNGRVSMLVYLVEEANANPYRLIFDLIAKKPPLEIGSWEKEQKEMATYLFANKYLDVNDPRLREIVDMPELEIAKPLLEIIERERCNRAGN